MKNISILLGLGLVSVFAGCSTVSTQPVGPNPNSAATASSTGQLEVFSRDAKQNDAGNVGENGIPGWRQYTAYDVYDRNGNLFKHVDNSNGHYGERPQLVALPAGQYTVKAQARDYVWVKVPVEIESGRTTRIHLDEKWTPSDANQGEIVRGPDGTPVGWKAQPE